MTPRPTLYILDAYSLIYQVFHAIPLMTGPSGQPTQAVFGVFRDLLNLLKSRKPDYLAGAFDGGGKTFRSQMYAEYKGQRKAMPEDLVPQIPVIRRLFEAFRIPVLLQPGFEADDVIATLARRGAARGLDVFICTADKDARQLLTDQIRIFNLRKAQVMDVDALKAEWGVTPRQVVDLLALTGDAVDNVPGVPGIGIKTGAKLLEQFGDLDTLLAHPEQVAGAKKQQSLRDHADTARRARELIVLREDAPLELDWDHLKVGGYDGKALKALCVECGFHRFLDEIVEVDAPKEAPWDVAAYRCVDTPEAFAAFLADLAKQAKISVDTETTSVDPLRAEIVGYSFAWEEGMAYYLPVRGPEGSALLDPAATLVDLRPILTDPAVEKVGQNLKYDMLVLRRAGIALDGPITDTMVLSYLLESGERNHNLDELSRRLLDHTMIPITSLIGKGKGQVTIDKVEVAKVAAYAGEDADAAWRLEEILAAKVREEGLWDLYAEVERPLIGVLARMEAVGVKVDVDRLRQLSGEFAARLETIRDEIYEKAGREFNIGSGPQLRQVLFDEQKLPILQRTPGGEPSTAVEVLEELAAKHPLPRLIIQHRSLDKLKGTYLDALPGLAHEDGRIHASFNQVVAATGRLSSSDPNLQNIPVRTEDGRQIRQAFIPGFPGWSLLTADYSQIELRILAHYSKDPALVRAFAEDRDIHAAVAARIFDVAEAAVDGNQRRVAKTVNFGVIYGLSAFGLAARLGIPQDEARRFIDAYFDEYTGVETFITATLEKALKDGRVETILGRRRAISGMEARMLLQIHDELVFEAPEGEIPALASLVREAMTGALPLDVPIGVDVAFGPNWLDVESI